MTLYYDNAAESGYKTGLSTYAWNHAVLYPRYPGLIVGVSLFASGSVSSITATVSGQPVRPFVYVREDHSGLYRSEIWCLTTAFDDLTDPFTASITLTLSGSITSMGCSASYAYFGGIGFHAGVAGGGAEASLVLASTADRSILFGNLTTSFTGTITEPGGQVSRYADSGALGSIRGSDTPVIPLATAEDDLTFTDMGGLDTFALSVVELLSLAPLPPRILG